MATHRRANREARCVGPVRADLGEGPLWIAEEAAVYWVDILQANLFRYTPAHGRSETCVTPFPLTSLAPTTSGHLLCTAYQALHRFDTRSGEFTPLKQAKIEQPGARINDGSCHPDGAFWFGTMDLDECAPIGDFHRLAPDGACNRIATSFAITNGPAFTPAGDFGYFVDTLGRRILRASMNNGIPIEPLQPFVQIPEEQGYPDGITVDAEGGVWCAHWGGGRITRFDVDGRVSEVIHLPVSNVTKCAFGGERLDRLFITTARKGLDQTSLALQPLAGGLFEVEVDYRGIAPACYGGEPTVGATSCTCVFESS